MKLARWEHPAKNSIQHGFVIEDQVIAFPDDHTVEELLALGLRRTREIYDELLADQASLDSTAVALDSVRLLAPLQPASIRDFVAFEEHVEGVTASIDGASNVVPEWYEYPTFYFTNPHTVVAGGDTIQPPETQRLDFELELAAVIGQPDSTVEKNGRNLTPDEAKAHIFGYMVMNDWSARDIQGREMKVRLGPAKGKDFAMTLGPWIVTADEVETAHDEEGFLELGAQVWVNDELVGTDMISNMGWPFAELVAYASRNSRVVPGDVLGSGTTGNGGCLAELWGKTAQLMPAPLRENDRVRIEIETIGTIDNIVGTTVPVPPIASARPRPRTRPKSHSL